MTESTDHDLAAGVERTGFSASTMSSADLALEKELQAKGLNAPRVTPGLIDAELAAAKIDYLQPEGTTVTVAVVQLANGFTLIGKSAAASPANFDVDVGRRVALDDARDQLWPLLGFRLRDQLATTQQ